MTLSKTTPVLPSGTLAKVLNLKNMETRLGNLPPETWVVSELHKRVIESAESTHALETETETLFAAICEDLSSAGMNSDEISSAINAHLFYENGPKYCNASEVQEALSS